MLLLTLSNTVIAAESKDYVLDGEVHIPIPLSYEPEFVMNNLGQFGYMNHPEDIFIDSKGIVYVADTGNNRIVKMDAKGKVLATFTGPKEKPLNKPSGIYVDDEENMFIADTGNSRITCLSSNGEYKKQYVKPNSTLLGSNFTFDPSKIFVNSTGYLFVLKSSSFLSMDEQNNFRGFIGAKEVGFDFRRMLIRIFASKDQKDRTVKKNPDAYSNFVIAEDGMIYGTVGNAASGQIRKLNSVGKNTYPNIFYGEKSIDKNKNQVAPNFVDIAVDKDGIISVLEKNLGKIYQYDQEGNLLAVFGGLGDYKGTFQIPSSLAVDKDGKIYVIDSKANTLQIFEPTNFIKLIHQAVKLYGEGNYVEAKKYWQEVLKIDANYSLAHRGIAKLYYKEGKWKDALEEYRAAGDTKGYSEAFSEYRHDIFRNHFGVVTVSIVGIIVIIVMTITRLKRKSNIIADKVTMGKGEI